MPEIMLVGNPSRRRKARKGRKGRRRMSALQRKYFGGGSRKRRRRRSSASAAPRRSRRRRNVYLGNPRRRRRRRAVVSFRRRRRNPSLRGAFNVRSAMNTVQSGLVGASGAIGLDLLWGYSARFLPAQIAGSALAQYAAKLVGAILVGVIGNTVMRGRGRDLAVGATTVVLHDALKAQLKASFPALQLGEYLTYAPVMGRMNRAGPMLSTGMGEYLSGIPNDGSGGVADDMSYTGEWNGDGMNGY